MAGLKPVYKADTLELAEEALDELEKTWGKKYPPEIHRLIYTTNSIENFNRQLRKVTKSRTIFPTDDALFKMLYLAVMDAAKKWTGKSWAWGQTLLFRRRNREMHNSLLRVQVKPA